MDRRIELIRKRADVVFGNDSVIAAFDQLLAIMISEAIDGFANQLTVIVFEDGSIAMSDNGRGMYLDNWKATIAGEFPPIVGNRLFPEYFSFFLPPNPKKEEIVHNQSTKYMDLFALNCVCERFYFSANRAFTTTSLLFEKGKQIGDVKKEFALGRGTFIHFKFDNEVFPDPVPSKKFLQDRFGFLRTLLPGLKIEFRYRYGKKEP